MATVSTFDMTGKQTGSMELSDAIFGIEPNAAVLHSVVVNYLANQRQGTQSTLTRAEVSGGGRKPWRQKGTGHARQGSIRAPQWTHGGISHGPKPRSYSYTLPKKTLREFRFDNCDAFNVGDIVKADTFAPGERVDVCGTSKGKGYAGAIKRWNFHRLKESHGTGPVARHAGSLGACSSPSRVFKGMKAAGHLGAERVTVQNLDVVKVDAENNLIAVRGAIPGPRGGVVLLSESVKKA